MSSGVKAFVFDLGNVIVDLHLDRFLPTLGLDHQWSTEEALKIYEQSGLSRDFELGNISFDEFYQKSCEVFKISVERGKFLKAWNSIIGNEKEGISGLVESCAEKAPVYLLSNTNEPHYRWSLNQAPALHKMEEHFLSYELNLLKPAPRIYTETVERIGFPAENLFFIDDREDNIASALQVGLNAVQFKNAEQLKQVLEIL